MSHDLTVEEGLFVGHKNDEEIGGIVEKTSETVLFIWFCLVWCVFSTGESYSFLGLHS